MKCRYCSNLLKITFVNLGFSPPSNAYLTRDDLQRSEISYPLEVRVCGECWLVQTIDYTKASDLFQCDYAYFSSTSSSWLEHARSFVDDITNRLNLNKLSYVIEIASNDGYLLKNFVEKKIPCLGIEPTASTAAVAEKQGIPVIREFFGERIGSKLRLGGALADLLIGNNVLAHVPDINDFVVGVRLVLKPEGVVTFEFPHFLCLLKGLQFDTIYHEHYSYLSLGSVLRIFKSNGLRVWHIEKLPTHGGSLRVYGCLEESIRVTSSDVIRMLEVEKDAGLEIANSYGSFQSNAEKVKNGLLEFLLKEKRNGKKTAAYGAAAKGNTLLNFAGVKPDLLDCVYDAAPSKQWKLLPGSHVEIRPPAMLKVDRPDNIIILPWNLSEEILYSIEPYLSANATVYVAVPEMCKIKRNKVIANSKCGF